ncbi:MAG: hypothetical protein QM736_28480 [Vicinamibacterales bacterium]
MLIAVPRPPQQQPAPIEPTVMIRRDQLPNFGGRGDETMAIPAVDLPPLGAPVSTPQTVGISTPPPSSPPPRRAAASSGGFVGALKGLFDKKGTPASAGPKKGSPVSPAVLMAVGGFVLAALLVYGGVRAYQAFAGGGYALTLTKPTGGTIVGGGLECGSRGENCTATLGEGEAVELQAVADSGFVFTSFTGDCAPTGRMMMTAARTCGATFQQVSSATPGVSWPLTITKPTGGTIVAAGGILCGSLGANCTASVPDGAPVNLHVEPDSGFALVSYTGDCAPNGDTTMTAARSCGATFAPTATAKVEPPPPPPSGGGTRRASAGPINVAVPPPVAPPPAPAATPAAEPPPAVTPLPTQDAKDVAAAISPEEHARQEITQLIRAYCRDLESLKEDAVANHFQAPEPQRRQLRSQFRDYRSLNCTITTEKPTFETLQIGQNGGAGTAMVLFDMKQVIQTKTGGAPQTVETNVTMVASRPSQRDPWKIERVQHKPKPKP